MADTLYFTFFELLLHFDSNFAEFWNRLSTYIGKNSGVFFKIIVNFLFYAKFAWTNNEKRRSLGSFCNYCLYVVHSSFLYLGSSLLCNGVCKWRRFDVSHSTSWEIQGTTSCVSNILIFLTIHPIKLKKIESKIQYMF